MNQEVLKIRDYILKSNLPDRTKNEIIPLLSVIDSPGVKEHILKLLEVEKKVVDLEERIMNIDLNGSLAQTSTASAVQTVPPQPITNAQTPQPLSSVIPQTPVSGV